jgi:hypothetical protein
MDSIMDRPSRFQITHFIGSLPICAKPTGPSRPLDWQTARISDAGGGCRVCRYGCFALAALRLQGQEPNQPNICHCLNNHCDVVWAAAGLKGPQCGIVAPSIARVAWRRSQFVHIESRDGWMFRYFDPMTGRNQSKPASAFHYCHPPL